MRGVEGCGGWTRVSGGCDFLHLVQQDHLVGPTPHGLGQLTALLVPHLSRAHAQKTHGMAEQRTVSSRSAGQGGDSGSCRGAQGWWGLTYPGGAPISRDTECLSMYCGAATQRGRGERDKVAQTAAQRGCGRREEESRASPD